jgi:uncharacterized protein
VATPVALSSSEARWLAIDAQALGRPRPSGLVGRDQLRALIDRIGVIQLDAIRIVERTQFLVPFSRLGSYDIGDLQAMSGPGGELLEYWGHAASLLPMAVQPLFRWRMAQGGPHHGGPKAEARRTAWWDLHGNYVLAVLREVTERGPLTAAQLSDPRRQTGTWWDRRSIGRQALEVLFARGELAAWRTASFERVYDLTERVVPRSVSDQPTPTVDDAHRQLLLLAARALGVGTVNDLAGYYFIKATPARARIAELVESGELLEVAVEGWKDPAYVVPGARPRRPARTTATLLSPFDSFIWDRARTKRVLGFDYRIEVYTPGAARRHGYYVLPLLLGDALAGRLDLKADRKASSLLVLGAFVEDGVDRDAVVLSAAAELDAMRGWLGLATVSIAARGDLARRLQRATRA